MKTGRQLRPCVAAAFVLVLGVNMASAQEAKGTNWLQGTALSIFGGAATEASTTGGAIGAAIVWELTHHFSIEGSGTWLDRPHESNAFAAVLGPRVHLTGRRTVIPFLDGGIALFRQHDNNNFASSAGGGVDVYVSPHLAVRPEVRVLFVTGSPDLRYVTMYGVHLAYHFESHNVTPSRRLR